MSQKRLENEEDPEKVGVKRIIRISAEGREKKAMSRGQLLYCGLHPVLPYMVGSVERFQGYWCGSN